MRRFGVFALLVVTAATASQPANDNNAAQARDLIRLSINQARTAIEQKDWTAARVSIDRSRQTLLSAPSLLDADEYKRLNAEIDQAADDLRVLSDPSIPEATRARYYEATLRLRQRQGSSRPAAATGKPVSAAPQAVQELTGVLDQFVPAANEALTAVVGRDAKLDACFGHILNRPIRLAAKTVGVTAKVPLGDAGLFGDRPNRALVVLLPATQPPRATTESVGSRTATTDVFLQATVELYLSASDDVLNASKKGDDVRGRITLTRGEIIPAKQSVAGREVMYAGTIRFLGDFQSDAPPRPLAVNPPAPLPPAPVPDPLQPIVRSVSKIKKVVFVCDASGSMLQKFEAHNRELSRTIHQLQPDQSFNVIFFQEQTCKSMAPNLLVANPDTKRQADQFIETIVPRAETNPIPALELAFKQKPDLIYLLTDGDFPNNKAVLKRIQELEKAARVKINTIAFVNEKDKDTDFMALLQKIAKDTGGVYRYVRENSLN